MTRSADNSSDTRLAAMRAKLSPAQLVVLGKRPSKTQVCSDADLELPVGEDRTPPTELQLFKTGWNVTSKGNFLWDELSALQVMTQFLDQGVDLMVDWEHRSLVRDEMSRVDDTRAAGWYRIEARDDGLWAVGIRWTPAADAQIRNGEYRYFSPAFDYDANMRVTKLLNFALTNRPATKNQPALVAANQDTPTIKEKRMNPMSCAKCSMTLSDGDEGAKKPAYCSSCAGMGTKAMSAALSAALDQPIASEADAITAVSAVVGVKRELLSATGAKSPAEAVGILLAWKASHDRVGALTVELERVKKEQRVALCSSLIEQGKKDGKITPSTEAYWRGQAEKDGGDASLQAFLSAQTPVVVTEPTAPAAPAELHKLVTLSDEDRKVAKMLNITEEKALEGKRRQLGKQA